MAFQFLIVISQFALSLTLVTASPQGVYEPVLSTYFRFGIFACVFQTYSRLGRLVAGFLYAANCTARQSRLHCEYPISRISADLARKKSLSVIQAEHRDLLWCCRGVACPP